ncbi:hypothetical protein [Diaphorobacter aerolatus]|uniref:Sn-glycerol-3-phosphate transporter n=1 Tax=Diaphorobacter aerolatus TaxID=1288495 RepID=A0A7H0GJM7_9BURK|nr:hypothetical protein [Diaphorobacter aerolatus]QNP48493.1 hypothetical protein H9K75_21650 [Diaphorobacter aerolatus]
MMISAVLRPVLLSATLLLSSASIFAASADSAVDAPPSALAGWMIGYAPYTHHFSDAKKEHDFEPDEEKHKYVWLLTAEKELGERELAGFAVFNNSFGQFSQYGYYGWKFRPLDSHQAFFFKLTGGVIHGYKYPYNKKIPLNNKNGWGVTVIPAIGWDFGHNWGAQVNLLGKSALMFQASYTFR